MEAEHELRAIKVERTDAWLEKGLKDLFALEDTRCKISSALAVSYWAVICIYQRSFLASIEAAFPIST